MSPAREPVGHGARPCRSLTRMQDLSRGDGRGEYGVLRAATGACYASISWA
jgi:hypothetical protein